MKAMKRKTSDSFWKQITVCYTSPQHLNEEAWKEVERIERVAQSDLLYFARYSDPKGNKLVVKVHTARSCAVLKRLLGLDSTDVIVMSEPGSTAHAHGYRIIKASRTQKDPSRMLYDVVHWMMNMAGHNYLTEVEEYLKMAYGGVQNQRASVGDLPPPGPPAPNKVPVTYEGCCRKCRKAIVSTKLGLQKCPHGCGGKAMTTVVKE